MKKEVMIPWRFPKVLICGSGQYQQGIWSIFSQYPSVHLEKCIIWIDFLLYIWWFRLWPGRGRLRYTMGNNRYMLSRQMKTHKELPTTRIILFIFTPLLKAPILPLPFYKIWLYYWSLKYFLPQLIFLPLFKAECNFSVIPFSISQMSGRSI